MNMEGDRDGMIWRNVQRTDTETRVPNVPNQSKRQTELIE